MTPEQIREARKSLGLNQAQFAAMLGYRTQARVSEVETGKFTASESVARLIQAYIDGYRPADWPATAKG